MISKIISTRVCKKIILIKVKKYFVLGAQKVLLEGVKLNFKKKLLYRGIHKNPQKKLLDPDRHAERRADRQTDGQRLVVLSAAKN